MKIKTLVSDIKKIQIRQCWITRNSHERKWYYDTHFDQKIYELAQDRDSWPVFTENANVLLIRRANIFITQGFYDIIFLYKSHIRYQH